jgi:hypothetical protein
MGQNLPGVLARSLFIKSGGKMQALLKCGKRNSTAEISEPAEVKKAKGLRNKEISKKTSGFSASSSFILLSLCAENLEGRTEEEMGPQSPLSFIF